MGASKKDFIEDAAFNAHYCEDCDNCGSFETQEAIARCYSKRCKPEPPKVKFVPASKTEKENWDYLKLTSEDKKEIDTKHLQKHGINF